MLRNLINFTFINLTPEREGPEKHTSFVAQTSQDFNPPPSVFTNIIRTNHQHPLASTNESLF